jgi:hypothetical protein
MIIGAGMKSINTKMDLSNIKQILLELSKERQIFHSEADFQHSLACKFNEHKKALGIKEIRLERRSFIDEKNDYIDIVLVTTDNKLIPIELKYKTKKTPRLKDQNGEEFELKNHGARDLGGYNFIKDIQRIESFIKKYLENSDKGYVIFLTNDPSYLTLPKKSVCYANFSIHQSRKFGNETLCWFGEKKSWQEEPIKLKGKYELNWEKYSSLEGQKFNFILLEI